MTRKEKLESKQSFHFTPLRDHLHGCLLMYKTTHMRKVNIIIFIHQLINKLEACSYLLPLYIITRAFITTSYKYSIFFNIL